MAGFVERLALVVDANTRGAVRDFDRLGRAAKVNLGDADKGINRFTESVRGAIPVIGGMVTAGVIGFERLASTAGELAAVEGSIDRVFGAGASQVQRFTRDAEALGLSQLEAGRAATLLGGQLVSLGFDADDASDRAQSLIRRAADLSVGFGSTQDAVVGISAILRNEFDTIEKFAVSLKKSDINARLAAQGLDTLEGEALKNAEAIAAVELLMESSANRAGAWADDTNRAARAQAELAAKLDNLEASLGAKVMPAFVGFIELIDESIDRAGLLNRALGDAFSDLKFGPGDDGGGNKGPFDAILDQLRELGSGDELDMFVEKQERLERASASATAVLEQLTGGFRSLGDEVAGTLDPLGAAVDFLGRAVQEAEDAPFESLFSGLFGVEDALAALDERATSASSAHKALSDAQRQQADAAEAVRDAQMDVAEAMAATFDATEAASRATADYAAEQRAAVDPLFAMIRALERQEELLASGIGVKKEGTSLTASGDKPSLLDFAEGAAGVEQAAIGLAGAIQTGAVSVDAARTKFRQWVQQGLITEKQAGKLAAIIDEAAKKALALEGATVESAIASEVAAEQMEHEAEKAEAVRDAKDRLEDAQRRLVDANERVSETTQGVVRSQDDAVRKAEALDRAMFDLNEQVQNNPTLISEAKAKLDDWVQRGLIPANEAADRLYSLITNVNTALSQFGKDGDYSAEIQVTADIAGLIHATDDPGLQRALRMMWIRSFTTAMLDLDRSGYGLGDIGAIGGVALDLTGQRASGGPVSPGTWLVGERGPELLQLGSGSGRVYNASQTRSMMGPSSPLVYVENMIVPDVESGIRAAFSETKAAAHRAGLG